jgi:hypothetical protein
MNKLTLRDLKQFLNTRTKEELIRDIGELFSKIDSVQEYYQSKLNLGFSHEVLDKYKAIIKNEFFPSRGFHAFSLSVARKAISDYKKVSSSKMGLADIMLYYVEMGVKFTNTYGDIDEPFYNSMESMYKKAVEFIVKNLMKETFRDRCEQIVRDTEGIGWGFHDGLSDIYEAYYRDDE